ncbi:Piso0_001952 [Millerozyma farinosa CBS 7064]|uniref:Piso0_001952 protein n=1 Tax=Pichia sorbitophila (strain ATCC MYA-4447 / BCRC 22081 / CBS 7064 / NBRC 10061 / NRRL Y-12695) TaxID=559304 RepID=G8YM51_PICSO|nr:Piso0_001952 [Millerozyma farinosa CBS 7064]
MNSIKDAISKVVRSVNKLEGSSTRAPSTLDASWKERRGGQPQPTRVYDRIKEKGISREDVKEHRHLTRSYQRKLFQDFLEPLNMPYLKAFGDRNEQYDNKSAGQNWRRKHTKTSSETFERFLEERDGFNNMMDLLLEVTPDYMKMGTIGADKLDARTIDYQLVEEQQKKHRDITPRYHFHEIPPMPTDSPEKFEEYIYFLTHSKILYQNSSSLSSGLVAEILLHTHKLTNTEYKHLRSVHTYNFLIKYFGFDKHQSAFARELLLVMNKDGHRPNIDTINNLLKSCKIHSNIRSLTNTYYLVRRYLMLMKKLGLAANLTTWCRIYDSISNIYLKEHMINMMTSINLPISRALAIRILDDYMKTTTDTKEIMRFVVDDLRIDWNNDSRFLNKILYHAAVNYHQESMADLQQLFAAHPVDEHSVKYVVEGIARNVQLQEKVPILLSFYSTLDDTLLTNPDVFRLLIRQLCLSSERYDHQSLAFIVRGLIHDAVAHLHLPSAHDHSASSAAASSLDAVPSATTPEYLRIMKRLVGRPMLSFEAALAYTSNQSDLLSTQPLLPSNQLLPPLSAHEVADWTKMKNYCRHGSYGIARPAEASTFNLKPSHSKVPSAYIESCIQTHYRLSAAARNSLRIYKLSEGLDTYTVDEMVRRSILDPKGV